MVLPATAELMAVPLHSYHTTDTPAAPLMAVPLVYHAADHADQGELAEIAASAGPPPVVAAAEIVGAQMVG